MIITKIIHEELGHGKTLFIDMNLGLWLKPYYKQKFFYYLIIQTLYIAVFI